MVFLKCGNGWVAGRNPDFDASRGVFRKLEAARRKSERKVVSESLIGDAAFGAAEQFWQAAPAIPALGESRVASA
jgi:hypothetical protein